MTDNPNLGIKVKSKAELRAERRAIQEAQRALKAANKGNASTSTKSKPKTSSGHKMRPNESNSPIETSNATAGSIAPVKSSDDGNNADLTGFQQTVDLPRQSGDRWPKTSYRVAIRKQETCQVHLFKHLDQPDRRLDVIGSLGLGSSSPIHPAFLALAVDFDEGRICGSNKRCLAFLLSCETLIRSYKLSPFTCQVDSRLASAEDSFFARSFGPVLQRHVNFLCLCRPLAVTMRNAYQFLKQTLNQLHCVENWEECRSSLISAIEDFRRDSIFIAGAEIEDRTISLIRPGELICTFGYSSLVARILKRAWQNASSVSQTSIETICTNMDKPQKSKDGHVCGSSHTEHDIKNFSVLIIDSRPKFEGRQMLIQLSKAGIPCEYAHINALPSLAKKVTLVIVGAHGLLSNGYVLARIGTAQVANTVSLISHSPIIVCAETYKFWEHAHSDAFEYNEVGDPDDIWRGPRGTSRDYRHGIPGHGPSGLPGSFDVAAVELSEWRSNPHLRLLHLMYDVLPPELVTAVVTEKGTLPTTSVPVVLRVKQATSIPV